MISLNCFVSSFLARFFTEICGLGETAPTAEDLEAEEGSGEEEEPVMPTGKDGESAYFGILFKISWDLGFLLGFPHR